MIGPLDAMVWRVVIGPAERWIPCSLCPPMMPSTLCSFTSSSGEKSQGHLDAGSLQPDRQRSAVCVVVEPPERSALCASTSAQPVVSKNLHSATALRRIRQNRLVSCSRDAADVVSWCAFSEGSGAAHSGARSVTRKRLTNRTFSLRAATLDRTGCRWVAAPDRPRAIKLPSFPTGVPRCRPGLRPSVCR